MRFILQFIRILTTPDNNPWLVASRAQLEDFYLKHPHIRPKDVNSAADNMAASTYKPERNHD